jgi:iron complex outermembrane recepter protein
MTIRTGIFIVFAFTIALATTLLAQSTLRGVVVDQQTRKPLTGAIIAFQDGHVATNDNGEFELTASQPINRITVQLIGYERKEIAVSGLAQPITISLQVSAVQFTGIEITGNRLLTQAQSIGALTPRDLARGSGLTLENSVNTVPGVFMQSRTPWGGARISIRGYYPNFSTNSNGYGYQLFINNIPVTDATGLTILDDIDFASLGNVAVIKGPSSSLYGGAIAGTVNLKTAQPAPGRSSIDEQATGGSYGLFRNNVSYQGSGDNSDITVNYGHQTYKGFREHTMSQKDFFRFTGDFRPNVNQSISSYFSFNRSNEEIAGELDSADFYNRVAPPQYIYINNGSRIQIESFRGGVTGNYQITGAVNATTTFFGSGQTMSQPFAHGFNDTYRFSYGARTLFGYKADCGEIGIAGTLGASFQRTNLATTGVFIVPAPPHPQRYTNQENYAMAYALFTEWNVSLPYEFVATVGASVNRNEFGLRNMIPKNNVPNDTTRLQILAFKPVFTPRFSILKTFNDNISVYASISTGFTPPSISNITASNIVDTLLNPERATQIEFGTKGNLLDRKLSYQVSLFNLDIRDKLVTQTINAVNFTVNAGKQRNRGAEVSASYSAIDNPDETLSLLRPWASYTYSDFKYVSFKSNNNNNAGTVDYSGKRVARVPKNTMNLGLDAVTNIGFYFYGSYQFVDKVPVTFDNLNFMKSYSLLSAKIGYQTHVDDRLVLDLFVGGDNLTGSTYYSFLNISGSITGLSQATGGDGYIIPAPYKATFYGGAKLSLAL